MNIAPIAKRSASPTTVMSRAYRPYNPMETQTGQTPEVQPTPVGVGSGTLVRCSDCQHWAGHEYPPAFDKAYCEVFDKYTPGCHGGQCTAFSAPNTSVTNSHTEKL